jgi:hypothetical protein
MRWRPGPGLTILAVVIVALGVLAVTGRMLAPDPVVPPTSTQAPPLTAGLVEPSELTTIPRMLVPEPEPVLETATSRGVLVPNVVGKSLAEGRRLMKRAGLRGSAVDRDPQAPDSVIYGQEPPPGILVPPGSVVGFRTKRFR